jgi:aspartate/methionine/tyrosine aminotransferase
MSVEDLAASLREEESVLLLPGSCFCPELREHFRIGFGRANIQDALRRFDAWLARHFPPSTA